MSPHPLPTVPALFWRGHSHRELSRITEGAPGAAHGAPDALTEWARGHSSESAGEHTPQLHERKGLAQEKAAGAPKRPGRDSSLLDKAPSQDSPVQGLR